MLLKKPGVSPGFFVDATRTSRRNPAKFAESQTFRHVLRLLLRIVMFDKIRHAKDSDTTEFTHGDNSHEHRVI
jgi:hypothetical protein